MWTRRERQVVYKKRIQRIYREERLTVRRRGGRKRAIGTRRLIETALTANQRWSLDFVSDQLTDGRRFRILTLIDELHARMPGPRWPTRRCRAGGSRGSCTTPSFGAAGRRPSSATMGQDLVERLGLHARDGVRLRQLLDIVDAVDQRIAVGLGRADPEHIQDDLGVLRSFLSQPLWSASRVRASATEEISLSWKPASARRQANALW